MSDQKTTAAKRRNYRCYLYSDNPSQYKELDTCQNDATWRRRTDLHPTVCDRHVDEEDDRDQFLYCGPEMLPTVEERIRGVQRYRETIASLHIATEAPVTLEDLRRTIG